MLFVDIHYTQVLFPNRTTIVPFAFQIYKNIVNSLSVIGIKYRYLYQGLMEFTEMKHLTPTVVNKLIERIEIHNNEKKYSHNNVKVDIYFTAVGLFDIPTEQQLINTMERVKQKKAEKSA